MLPATEHLSRSEVFQLLAFLAGLSVVLYLVVTSTLGPRIDKTGTIWHHVPAAAMGVDAAERGDTRRLLLEKVPYDLQKRAILHKRWLMIGHDSQWAKPGTYRTFTVAEIPFVVIRGEDGKLRAFHNVCRHRAYAVVRKPAGRSLRLACKYHGWQYDAAGRLLKAPCFPADRPDVLDARENGLFAVHLRIDSGRFVFVNFASNLADAFPWGDISPSRLRSLDFGGAEEWEVEVESDWRLASLLPWFINPSSFPGLSRPRRFLNHVWSTTAGTRLQYVDDASFICDVAGKYHLLVSALPKDSKRTTIRTTLIPQCQHQGQPGPEEGPSPTTTIAASSSSLYHLLSWSAASIIRRRRHEGRDKTKQVQVDLVRKRVNSEVESAIAALQRHRTTSTNLDFRQSAIRERLDKFNRHVWHHKTLEKAAGRKINAAARGPSGGGGGGGGASGQDMEEAEAICSLLEGLVEAGDVDDGGPVEEDLFGELEW